MAGATAGLLLDRRHFRRLGDAQRQRFGRLRRRVVCAWDGMSHRRRVAGLSACAAHARAIAARVAAARSGDSEAAVAFGATAARRLFGVAGAVL